MFRRFWNWLFKDRGPAQSPLPITPASPNEMVIGAAVAQPWRPHVSPTVQEDEDRRRRIREDEDDAARRRRINDDGSSGLSTLAIAALLADADHSHGAEHFTLPPNPASVSGLGDLTDPPVVDVPVTIPDSVPDITASDPSPSSSDGGNWGDSASSSSSSSDYSSSSSSSSDYSSSSSDYGSSSSSFDSSSGFDSSSSF